MRRVTVVMGSVLALVVTTVAPVSADQQDTTVYPDLAGTTVIHSEGVSGIKVWVPTNVRWLRDNIELDYGPDVNKVSAGIRNRGTEPDVLDFSGTFVSASAFWGGTTFVGGCDDDGFNEVGCTVGAGLQEIYLVADGPVTLTMRFPELAGSLELAATGVVDGVVEEIPAECLVDDCSIVGGGKAREVGTDGRAAMAGITAWVWRSVESWVAPTPAS